MSEVSPDMFVPEAASSDKLQMVRDLANDLYLLEKEIDKMEEDVKRKKAEKNDLAQKTIPDLMASLGLSEMASKDGTWKLTIKPFYDAKIDETNEVPCFAWLLENGHGALIKNTVKCDFDREDHEQVDKVMKILEEAGFEFENAMKIHPQTLKAFVKEQIEAGAPFPSETFKVHNGMKAEIKKGKKE